MRALRSERGGILALSALIIPGFLLITALVLDTGIWFTHKRSLQNRADSGALAAGVEYLSQLANCGANPTGPAATAIADKARLYAGATGTGYNETVNNQSEITVKINATGPTAADDSDGGNPCQDHAPDGISPNGGIWTDVIARETNLRTVAGTFGINLPSIAARARVELGQITGLTGGLPFVNETGDQIECVWAQFVRARDNNPTSGFTVTPSNPILLTKTGTEHGPRTSRTSSSRTRTTTWRFATTRATRTGRRRATSRPPTRAAFHTTWTHRTRSRSTGSTSTTPASLQEPTLPRSSSFRADLEHVWGTGIPLHREHRPERDLSGRLLRGGGHRSNKVRGTITVQPVQPAGSGIASVNGNFDTTGGGAGPNLSQVTGTITIRPNQAATGTGFTQDYTQVGETYFKAAGSSDNRASRQRVER